jgi:DNA-binding NarL/FixJ family response regulator
MGLEPAAGAVTCVLVDDHAMVLEALTAHFERSPRIRVVGTARDADEATAIIGQVRPQVIIADINLPDRTAFDAAGDWQRASPSSRILLLSGYLADIFVVRALKLDLAGYLLKGESLTALSEGVERVAAGERVYSPQVAQRMTVDPQTQTYIPLQESELATLTNRQLEVLRHLACGQSVKEIAKVMKLSQKSVDSHKYRIMNKLGIHDRVLLARYAIREGLMVP